MENILKNKGMKATPARLAILKVFETASAPLDAETVCRKLEKGSRSKKINEATIYRTLSSFEKNGVLKRVDLRKDSAYFELETADHHHHMVCIKCNDIEDFEIKEFERSLSLIVENSSNFKIIKDHSLEIFGLCRACI
jgi:Fur family transcriptional regulator, ferric uptake regulator